MAEDEATVECLLLYLASSNSWERQAEGNQILAEITGRKTVTENVEFRFSFMRTISGVLIYVTAPGYIRVKCVSKERSE